ncbi:1-(5-phosphoribosyl)-5-[(5-phosphoribosylamino)methylideneamino] imidazole-4-carboxamide isomerase [Anatilimnocola aggregata]|uniref:1-(5-phosphoribosyl)-5-[(5-phosphoribosylamino)methylideneamino] imidazole-4-carboxamide isomerase n=1 Tax=Anatilimnocola aggregata TaxID=2528021 RepID=A0A517Y5G9_9BACT|nr:HisA/HisF-related TIM barrel protein [Anatilimnocola aggregata]QDU25487.1 1-(5-phosphoribosyl)-5-[(5-phosphoribosylamino)methylideneamino] imidazole-4-carboxamide isomerase [Anatilimnocola aggregata]
MRVIPVIDLKEGLVVRGVGGRRDEYRPIVSELVHSSHPGAVATALKIAFEFNEIYVADLDAIMLGIPDIESWQAIAETGFSLLLDAGVSTADEAATTWQRLTRLPTENSRLVLGLESWSGPDELQQLAAAGLIPLERVVFSLDLQEGRPITTDAAWKKMTAAEIAAAVLRCGIRSLIVLDLAAVGSGRGISTLPLVRMLRGAYPQLEIIAGGGVRAKQDLSDLSQAGGSAVLVASALHDGRLSPGDLR